MSTKIAHRLAVLAVAWTVNPHPRACPKQPLGARTTPQQRCECGRLRVRFGRRGEFIDCELRTSSLKRRENRLSHTSKALYICWRPRSFGRCGRTMATQKPVEWVSSLIIRFEEQVSANSVQVFFSRPERVFSLCSNVRSYHAALGRSPATRESTWTRTSDALSRSAGIASLLSSLD